MMKDNSLKGKVITPATINPWPHEIRVAKILALAGHAVIFLERTNLHTPDILLDGIEYEIKSPEAFNTNTLEHTIKDALKQSPNIIIDSSRIKKIRDDKIRAFLINLTRRQKQIRHMIMITKLGQIVDISSLV